MNEHKKFKFYLFIHFFVRFFSNKEFFKCLSFYSYAFFSVGFKNETNKRNENEKQQHKNKKITGQSMKFTNSKSSRAIYGHTYKTSIVKKAYIIN